jgi:hypothetical protein
MLGRRALMERLKRHLLRESPLHVSLIGPTQIGKSVVLRALATTMRATPGKLEAVVYWNLSHGTPNDDAEFFSQFHDHIRSAAVYQNPDWDIWFDSLKPREALSDFFDDVKLQEKTLLLILDSLDHPLSKGSISRNALDWMRSLSDSGSAIFVTGSRETLMELCKSEETLSSPFWNIFVSIEELGPWEMDEWSEILGPFSEAGIKFHKAAEHAIQEWTNGVPVLVDMVLSRLFESPRGTEIHERDVVRLCEEIANSEAQILKLLWKDCHPEWQSDIVDLCSRNIPADQMPPASLKGLRKRGYVRKKDGVVVGCCRFISQFAQQFGCQVAHVNRLFSDPGEYCKRIREVLEIRLRQLDGVDPMLLNFVRRSLRDLETEPEIPVYDMRGIAERAISLVVDAEFPDGTIDPSWVRVWQQGGATHPREALEGRLPLENGRKVDLLLLMTGDKKAQVIKRVANHISKGTALLISHLFTVGRSGVHRDENHEYGPLFAGSVCFAAVELCEHLRRELPRIDGEGGA